ncbi:MAG TPA: hypothetical protein VM512_11085, partial [Burkholderiaceae bacterium]|nr:hypothetical protein [Burkholderiaceae bacterium]
EILDLVLNQWKGSEAPQRSLQHTAVFLWLLLLILAGALLLDGWLLKARLEKHCNDFARPDSHIECAQNVEGEAGGEGQDVGHAADADPLIGVRP